MSSWNRIISSWACESMPIFSVLFLMQSVYQQLLPLPWFTKNMLYSAVRIFNFNSDQLRSVRENKYNRASFLLNLWPSASHGCWKWYKMLRSMVPVFYQGCHWTFAKITENLCACRLTENEHKEKRQKVQNEKDEIRPKITEKTENNG